MKLSNKYLGIGILIIVFYISFIISANSIIQVYPKNNSVITERQPTFEWAGKANRLIFDDNDEFVSPVIENVSGSSFKVKDKLNFKTYYWKLTGDKNSSVLQFTIDSIVALELKNQTNLYSITNVGTTDLDVEAVELVEEYPSVWKITGNLLLKLNETKQLNVKNKTIFIGRQR